MLSNRLESKQKCSQYSRLFSWMEESQEDLRQPNEYDYMIIYVLTNFMKNESQKYLNVAV